MTMLQKYGYGKIRIGFGFFFEQTAVNRYIGKLFHHYQAALDPLHFCGTVLGQDTSEPSTALRSITENVRERSPTVHLISTVRCERLQPITNAF